MHRRLAMVDPQAAARIHPHDGARIVRALEVMLTSGRTLSAWQAAHAFREAHFEALVVGLDVAPRTLAARIVERARRMLEAGWAEEVAALVARQLPMNAPVWTTVGYREIRACLSAGGDEEAALAAVVQATRQYARRQRTWFRAQPDICWRDPDRERARVVDEVEAFLRGGHRPVGTGQIAKLEGAS